MHNYKIKVKESKKKVTMETETNQQPAELADMVRQEKLSMNNSFGSGNDQNINEGGFLRIQ